MAKTYLNTVKYEIKAKYEVTGIVEKPDIIGAIFGQSEGMLGADMDLKDLQQAGKLGRIEISVNKQNGKTFGEVIIPSSLDQIKTSILAATVETVEKVGPCEAKVTILSIRDTRKEKREQITDRAKQLLQKMQKFENVESSDLTDSIKSTIRTEKAITYKGMTAGPEVESSEQIIVVEGRADVLKLLSYGIKNAIEMNGSNISKELIELCKTKNVIVLIDGDRGGDLNAKKLASLTKVDFIAKAPDGKEVEELTQKEILQALKRRQDSSEATNTFQRNNFNRDRNEKPQFQRNSHFSNRERPNFLRNNQYDNRDRNGFNRFDRNRPNNRFDRNQNSSYSQRSDFRNERANFQRNSHFDNRERFDPFKNNYRTANTITEVEKIPKTNEQIKIAPVAVKKEQIDIAKIEKDFSKIKGKLKARLYDASYKKIKDVDVKELATAIEKSKKKINVIAMDGIITKRIVEMAEKNEIPNIIGVKKSNIKSNKVNTLIMKN